MQNALGRKNALKGNSFPIFRGIRAQGRASGPWLVIGTTCYRTEKAESPKSAGESAGKSAGKKGTAGRTAGSSAGRPVSLEKQRNGIAPSSLPSSPLLPGTPPSTLPSTFGGLRLSQSCSRRSRLQPMAPDARMLWPLHLSDLHRRRLR